ncbi:MAG TPA: fibronectin type III domain-containing protein [Chryseosolibacter sp.]|nr:fibronectin type III domain-containing protein [Chryseosolibacter sp.]
MKISLLIAFLSLSVFCSAQVDTSYIYNGSAPYGTLDLRLAKSETRFYYLREGETFSFRESAGTKTNTYRDMTSWDSSPYEEGNLRERDGDLDYFIMNYRLLKPENYNASYDKGYPLIIMMHGSGEHGNCWNSKCYHATPDYSPVTNTPAAPTEEDHPLLNNDHNLLHGGKVYLDAVTLAGGKLPEDSSLPERAFPGFILFPQNLNGWSNSAVQDAIRIIRLLVKKYNIDEDRIYINGLSNGAHGAFEAIKRAPWMFSAAVVMSAVSDGFITNVNMESEVAHIPMWFFQGALDQQPTPSKTKNYIRKFRDAGAVVRYTEYEDVGHTTWNKAYKEPDFFTWMLGYRKSQLHTFAGSPTICTGGSSEGLLLRMAEGYVDYQWERNGQTISGANEASYTATTTGSYRGRFSRLNASGSASEWNEWSDEVEVTEAAQPVSEIEQIGTVKLPDLNGLNEAFLQSNEGAAHYYWYKNGTLLDLPGDQDDTLRMIGIKPGACGSGCVGNGEYTLVISNYDQCRSEPSAATHVFFNNQAPENINAPTNFSVDNTTSSSVSLKWNDNSGDENGFEIWRRKKLGDGSYSPWTMPVLTDVNVKSFTDTGLEPTTEYQYKVRAVGDPARSAYAPAGTSTLVVTTPEDSEPPSAPENLRLVRVALDKIKLSWSPAQDNSGIRAYNVSSEVGAVETTDTTLIVSDLQINTTYHFQVKAIDFGENESEDATTFFNSGFAGLFYEHLPGYWPILDSVNWELTEYTGFVPKFTLAPKTQDDYYAFRFDGYIYISTPGSYRFSTGSDDGSELRLNNVKIVNNDGIHNFKTVPSNAITLNEGGHRITVEFFEYADTDTLVVQYKGPDTGNEWMNIPDEILKSSRIVSNEPDQEMFSVNVFPNPAHRQDIFVRLHSRNHRPFEIRVADQMGKEVLYQQIPYDESLSDIKLKDTYNLAPGLYFIRVVQGSAVVLRKLIVQH